MTPTTTRSPAALITPMPTRRVQIPARVLRNLPSRSANAAMLVLAASSTAPNPIATTPIPPVETSNESLSQLPEMTNTEMPARASSADPLTTSHARAVSDGRRRRSLERAVRMDVGVDDGGGGAARVATAGRGRRRTRPSSSRWRARRMARASRTG